MCKLQPDSGQIFLGSSKHFFVETIEYLREQNIFKVLIIFSNRKKDQERIRKTVSNEIQHILRF